MERPRVLASMVGQRGRPQGRRATRAAPARARAAAGLLSLAPAAFALRGGELAAYHGAEHISIGTYEHGEARPKEHERCGSHLIGPMLLTTAAGNLAAERAPSGCARPRGSPARLGAARRVDGDLRLDDAQPEHPLARALAKPGHELQHRLGTREPTRRAARGRRGRAPRVPGARR